MSLFENAEIGQQLEPFSVTINWNMYKKYNRLVHEINPLHFNESYAKQLGYKTIVVAGVYTASFFLRPLLKWIKDPTAILNYEIRFHDPVYLGDTISHHASIRKKYEQKGNYYIELEAWVENQEKKRITTGTVTVVLNR